MLEFQPGDEEEDREQTIRGPTPSGRSRWRAAGPTTVADSQAYQSPAGPLAMIRAATAATNRSTPPTVSSRKTRSTQTRSLSEGRENTPSSIDTPPP